MRWLLFDVEGTITSLAFVRDELVPYARGEVRRFLQEQANRPEVAALLNHLAHEMGVRSEDRAGIAETLVQWIDEDRKQTDLKELQGLIWEDGYGRGILRGHLYPDVVPFWRRMRAAGASLAIFSSGSVQAQRLLLGHSNQGDVSSLVDRHFDTHIGAKADPSAYAGIAAALGVAPADMLFFSDAVPELDAARAVAVRTCRTLRPGVPRLPHTHPEIESFDEFEEALLR